MKEIQLNETLTVGKLKELLANVPNDFGIGALHPDLCEWVTFDQLNIFEEEKVCTFYLKDSLQDD